MLELIYATVRSQISSMIERRRIRKEHYFRLLNLKKKKIENGNGNGMLREKKPSCSVYGEGCYALLFFIENLLLAH